MSTTSVDSIGNSAPINVEYKLPEEEINELKKGNFLWKVRSINKWYRRRYYLDPDNQLVVYEGSQKFLCIREPSLHIDIREISDVRNGWKTDTFNRVGTKVQKQTQKKPKEKPLVDENCCFSIIYGDGHTSLDLVAPNDKIAESWVNGLTQVVAQYKSVEYKHNYQLWLKQQFRKADKNFDRSLNFSECLNLLGQLNIEVDDKYAKKLFNESNINKSTKNDEEVLDEDEFVLFYTKLLNRPELEELIRKFGIQNTELMGPRELYDFLVHQQKDIKSLKDCEAVIKGIEGLRGNRHNDATLSLGGFRLFLLSEQQNLFNFEHLAVYQDMTQPLTHYFISSSHNTYLLADQLTGESSVEGYISALKSGCKCVEMDIWDGDEGEPIIYHGHTLTSKISFKDVVSDAIKPFAFCVSEYPLILSFEIHCSVEQQKIVAKHLKTILGDTLYTTPIPPGQKDLPSPESLKGKIILKAKKLPEDDESGDAEHAHSNSETEEEQGIDDVDGVVFSKAVSISLAKELSDLVCICRSVSFKDFQYNGENGKCYDIVSLSEKKAFRLIADEAEEFVEHTKRQLVRIYPGGTRTHSSNYDPLPMWNVGCQVVALNYQTFDKPNLFRKAKFRQNGNCGYVLKPSVLIEGTFDLNTPLDDKYKKILKITVISGQHFPKPGLKMTADGDVVDPYVLVKIRGHPDDKQKFKTKTILNNGFNPIWNSEMTITVKLPELAFVHFIVRDEKTVGSDEKLGQCVLPFSSLQQGYRHVTLTDEKGNPIPPATLFVHVSISGSR
ncbi:hypothetical protein CHUAL_004687 [Chamberlinius hualienensis]